MKSLLIIICSVLTTFGFSQNPLKPVTWKAVYVPTNSSEGEIVFTAIIEKNWHIYSQRPTDAGPIPTSFNITLNPNFEMLGKVVEENAHEEFVPAFDAKVYVFADKAIFKQKIKLKSKKTFSVKSSVEFMTCNNSQCLPPSTIDFIISIPEVSAKK